MRESILYLCRHGDTEWSTVRRLAGRTDLPLTAQGEANARQLGTRLHDVAFDRALTSPLIRARRTAELAGFATATVDDRLREMDFGRYEGRTVDDIRRQAPDWTYLRDGCPDGENADDLARRADSLLDDVCDGGGRVVLFAHSVILRVVAARFLGLPASAGRLFMLSPGALSILGYDKVDDSRAIAAWNDRGHLTGQDGFA